ncbi:MAG: hypothetical protein WCR72_07920 [Bacteroidota bacterium]
MKKQIYLFALAVIMAVPFSSCKKDSSDPPAVATTVASSVTVTSASSGGTITSEGTSAVTARGVCWGTAASPTVADSKTTDGTGIGAFTSSITGLTPATLYHVRAYATNAQGTAYGEDMTFTTSSLIKTISFYALWAGGTEKWDFSYDATTAKVTKFDDYWEAALDKTITYDYTVAGKLTLMRGADVYGAYDINTQGYVTQDLDGNTYEYDANGFMVKYYEYWSSASHLKYQMEITDGNISKITTFDDDGVTAKKIKAFTYTIGDNSDGIHQANATDSDWKPIGNFYGKPSAKLVDYFEYWDPRATPIVKNKSSFTYTFDAKQRVSKAVKTLSADSSTEEWSYTYAE